MDDSETVGIVTDNGDGSFDYDPNGQFESLAVGETASDTFTYTVTDNNGGTSTATVTITITGQNDDPVALDDSASTDEDVAVTVAVLNNDSTVDTNNSLTVESVTQGLNGVVSFTDTDVTYTPNEDFNGTDSFTYTITDGDGGTATATVTIDVNSVNDAPETGADSFSVAEDTNLIVPVSASILNNDSDSHDGAPGEDNTPLTVVANSDPANGSVIVNENGSFTYQPAADFNGTDSFTYTVSDSLGATSVETVTITVTAVSDALADAISTPEDSSGSVNVFANDNFEDPTAAVTSVTQGTQGSVTFLADGTVTYTPNADTNGTDSFSYTVTAGGVEETQTVNVTISPVNGTPEFAVGGDIAVDEDSGSFAATQVTDIDDGDSEVEQSLTFNVSNDNNSLFAVQPAVDASGQLTFTPADDAFGTVIVTVTLTDDDTAGGAAITTAAQTFEIDITAVNDEESLDVNSPLTIDEGATGAITNALLLTSDIDSSTLTYVVDVAPLNGQLELVSEPGTAITSFTQAQIDAGDLVYVHNDSETTTDSFDFTVDDGEGTTTSDTFSIIITPVNDNAPVADSESFTVDEGGTATEADLDAGTSLLDGDTDIDLPGDTLTVNPIPVVAPANGTLILFADGTFRYEHDGSENFTDSFTYEVSDGINTDIAVVTITINAVVDEAFIAGRNIFYNGSSFDGNDSGANANDDGAIAPDKTALLPGETADFENYTSYSRGINGIIVDITDLASTPTIDSIGEFFEFRVGNDNTFVSPGWVTAPAPIAVTVRAGEGVGGSDRVTIIWADNAIEKQWLEVNVLANENTGLATPDTHYWGNAIGETGNAPGSTAVDAIDQAGARDNFTTFLDPAEITNPYDFDRSGSVNATDQTIARDNFTTFLTDLELISPPAGGSGSSSLTTFALDSRSSANLPNNIAASFAASNVGEQDNGESESNQRKMDDATAGSKDSLTVEDATRRDSSHQQDVLDAAIFALGDESNQENTSEEFKTDFDLIDNVFLDSDGSWFNQ